ncbi:MAG: GntR family transcriptional regulator [Rhodospirillales bacterium]|nr:GntR family transcriptional regulator [Rhodospirillales bacterium]MDE0381951.1 GntR family transcriptional regulator [Rhodospirillales bacterium]
MAAKTRAETRKRGRRGALQVYDVLREEILWVRIAPGTALDERKLAARFEVSRTPIREALLLLAGERLVRFLPNRTSIVAPFSLDNAGDYLDTALIIARAVARSAALSGRVDAAVLRERVQRFVRAVEADDWEDSLKCELEVLRHLAGLSGNIFLIKFYDEVIDAGMRMWVLHYVPNASTDERRAAVGRLEALVEAVLAGDAEASDRAIERMILADAAIVARSLEPRFGGEMGLGRFGEGLRAL